MAAKHKKVAFHPARAAENVHNDSATPRRLVNGDELPEPSEALKRVLAKRGEEIKRFREGNKTHLSECA